MQHIIHMWIYVYSLQLQKKVNFHHKETSFDIWHLFSLFNLHNGIEQLSFKSDNRSLTTVQYI